MRIKDLIPYLNNDGGANVLEIHLFVNPLGTRCLNSERDVLAVERQLQTKVSYQFIPLINMKTIQQTLNFYNLPHCRLKERQCISCMLYQTALDFKAASFQGGQHGRKYLVNVQKIMSDRTVNYTDEVVKKIAKLAGLDWETFLEDRQSQMVRKSLQKDQAMADDLGVSATPTAIVLDTNDPDYSLLIHDFTYQSLIDCARHGQLQINQDHRLMHK